MEWQLDMAARDGLIDIAKAGARRSSKAIGEMLDIEIDIDIPKIDVLSLEEAVEKFGKGKPHTGLFMGIDGDIPNNFLVLISEEDSIRIASRLTMDEMEVVDTDPDSMFSSSLKELGNILASSFSDGISEKYGINLYPTPPDMAFDLPESLFGFVIVQFSEDPEEALVFHTGIRVEGEEFDMDIMMIPPKGSWNDLIGLISSDSTPQSELSPR